MKIGRYKNGEQQGSALVLVIIGILILSLLGITGLRKTSTELTISRNFMADKMAFFAADTGINYGIYQLGDAVNPQLVSVAISDGNATVRSGSLSDYGPQYVEAFLPFSPPPPSGVSLDTGSGIHATGWQLIVSSSISGVAKGEARKELQTTVVLMSADY